MRRLQIERLRDYAANGVFPKNRVRPGMANIFIDEHGALCAAANLIALSGNRALVDDTANTNNLIRLADVKAGPLGVADRCS